MTNIKEKNNKTDVHLHIDKAYEKISGKLPTNYVDKVLEIITDDKTLTPGIIRNTKNRVHQYPLSRINVLNALVRISDQYVLELQELENLTK